MVLNSILKRVRVVFFWKRGIYTDPDIGPWKINGVSIPVQYEHTFLGMVLDNIETFIPHLNSVKHGCVETLSFVEVLLQ